MNKYIAVANSFCDACVNAETCKGTCKRLQTMLTLAARYEKLDTEYTKLCNKYGEQKVNVKDEA